MLMTKEQFKKELTEILDKEYDAKPSNASNELIYKATAEWSKTYSANSTKSLFPTRQVTETKRFIISAWNF